MKLHEDKMQKEFQVISFVFLLAVLIVLIWFINLKIDCLLNADDSSEMVLGKLLASENSLLSKNWYYSTELRVLNTQIFYAFFFKFINNWHAVRVLSYICMYLVLLLAYFLLCKEIECQKFFAITAALVIMPFSGSYFEYVLKGAYYMPHIFITFLTMALAELFSKTKGKSSFLVYVGTIVFSIVAGLGGARQLMVLYLPLILAEIVIFTSDYIRSKKEECGVTVFSVCKLMGEKRKRYLMFDCSTFIGAIIGYLVNTKILVNVYHFKTWENISYTAFDMSKFTGILNGFLNTYGYSTGRVFSASTLANFICLLWIILVAVSIIYAFKKRDSISDSYYRMAVYVLCAFVVLILLYLFTNLSYKERYNLPIIILSIPMIALFFNQVTWKNLKKNIIVSLFVVLVAVNSYFYYSSNLTRDLTKELRVISTTLLEHGYYAGYATFWNANILTELSDGNIDVWCWLDSGSDDTRLLEIEDINSTYKWLQLTSHDTTHPEGKIFLFFTNKEFENNNWKKELNLENILYQSDGYIVIGYDSYQALKCDLSE